MAKIIVTGGAGFIGSNIVDAYLKEGYKVAIIDNLSTGTKRNINKKAKFYQVDITNKKELREVFEDFKPNFINHHAANSQVRISIKKPVYDAKTNVIGSLNLIDLAKEFKIKKFIYAASGGVAYGDPKELPATELTPLSPLSPYAVTKHVPEEHLKVYNFIYGLDWIALRYSNVFGPRQDPNGEAGVIAIFAGRMLKNEKCKINGDGTNTRDYVFVHDVAEANVIAATKKTQHRAFNICSNNSISTQKIFDVLKKEFGYEKDPIYGPDVPEVRHISLDYSLAKKELGWKPKVEFQTGIRKTIEALKKEMSSVDLDKENKKEKK